MYVCVYIYIYIYKKRKKYIDRRWDPRERFHPACKDTLSFHHSSPAPAPAPPLSPVPAPAKAYNCKRAFSPPKSRKREYDFLNNRSDLIKKRNKRCLWQLNNRIYSCFSNSPLGFKLGAGNYLARGQSGMRRSKEIVHREDQEGLRI